MVTMHDIAEAAGVSAMTVSNVINGRTAKVSPATVRRVLDLVDKMGYVPNAQARALAANKSGIVALLYPVASGLPPLAGPHDGAFIAAAAEKLCEARLHVMIHSLKDNGSTRMWLRTWKVDGVIVIGAPAAPGATVRHEDGIPHVWLDGPGPGGAVAFDSDAAARQQAEAIVARLLQELPA